MTRLTDWFPADVKPVREGVYEIKYADDDGRCFAHWNGAYWTHAHWQWGATVSATIARAAANASHDFSELPWRGLAEKPE